MSLDLEKIKMCITESNIPIVNNQKSAKNRAVFFQNNKWDQFQTLKIYFYDPYNIADTLKKTRYNIKDNDKKLDPIQIDIENILSKGGSINIKKAIKYIIENRLSPIINLKLDFENVNPYNAHIVISFDNSIGAGSWSCIGKDSLRKRPSMQFGWFDVATVIHEFCHALGMGHEHQNPYGKGIQWNKEKVYEWARKTQRWNFEMANSQIINRYSTNLTNGTEYDPESIMLYFYPGILTLNGVGTTENLRLSFTDINYLSSKYPKSPDASLKAINLYSYIYGIKPSKIIKPPTTKPPTTKPPTTKPPTTKPIINKKTINIKINTPTIKKNTYKPKKLQNIQNSIKTNKNIISNYNLIIIGIIIFIIILILYYFYLKKK
jgi:hypothetical protein